MQGVLTEDCELWLLEESLGTLARNSVEGTKTISHPVAFPFFREVPEVAPL